MRNGVIDSGKGMGFCPTHRKIPSDKGGGWDNEPSSRLKKKRKMMKLKYGGGASGIGGAAG